MRLLFCLQFVVILVVGFIIFVSLKQCSTRISLYIDCYVNYSVMIGLLCTISQCLFTLSICGQFSAHHEKQTDTDCSIGDKPHLLIRLCSHVSVRMQGWYIYPNTS